MTGGPLVAPVIARDAIVDTAQCLTSGNCSNHGVCFEGLCWCELQYKGQRCSESNQIYFLAFAFLFFFLCAVSVVQLILCVRAEFNKLKNPTLSKACRITVQKVLYLIVIFATAVRGVYFCLQSNVLNKWWALNLHTSYYPVLLTGLSLLVCFWAEIFHLNVRCDRQEFLSKSAIAYLLFNVFIYVSFIAQFVASEFLDGASQKHLTLYLKGFYASLMIVVMTLFLYYGVEVFFRIRCNFVNAHNHLELSQVHLSRTGLIMQTGFQLFTALFLFSEVTAEHWKNKLTLLGVSYCDVAFRCVDLCLALWFPIVLWNFSQPEQLWILNPRRLFRNDDDAEDERTRLTARIAPKSYNSMDDNRQEEISDCWICYDNLRTDAGQLIRPCRCKGDVSVVHHECLKTWLLQTINDPSSLMCRVCNTPYSLRANVGSGLMAVFKPQSLKLWAKGLSLVAVAAGTGFSCTYVFKLTNIPAVRIFAVGSIFLIEYCFCRLMGFSLSTAYQYVKISAMQIVGIPSTGKTQHSVSECSEARSRSSTVVDVDTHNTPTKQPSTSSLLASQS